MMLFYSKKFALEISDTIQVVENGLSESNYLLRLIETNNGDEIDKLAKSYNEIWLPVKLKYKNEIYADNQDELIKQMDTMDIGDFLK